MEPQQTCLPGILIEPELDELPPGLPVEKDNARCQREVIFKILAPLRLVFGHDDGHRALDCGLLKLARQRQVRSIRGDVDVWLLGEGGRTRRVLLRSLYFFKLLCKFASDRYFEVFEQPALSAFAELSVFRLERLQHCRVYILFKFLSSLKDRNRFARFASLKCLEL